MEIERQQQPTRVILEQASPWSRWNGRIAWTIAGVALLSAIGSAGAFARYFQRDGRVVEKYHSLARTAAAKVAIVTLSGPIMGGEGFIRAQIDQVADVEAVTRSITGSPTSPASGSCRSWSAWGASPPVAGTTWPWPTGAART